MTTESLKAALEPSFTIDGDDFFDVSVMVGGNTYIKQVNERTGEEALIAMTREAAANLAKQIMLRASTDAAPVAYASSRAIEKLAAGRNADTVLCASPSSYAKTPLYAHPPVPDAAGEGIDKIKARAAAIAHETVPEDGNYKSNAQYRQHWRIAHDAALAAFETLAQPPAAEHKIREATQASVRDFRGRAVICRTVLDALDEKAAAIWDMAADALEAKL